MPALHGLYRLRRLGSVDPHPYSDYRLDLESAIDLAAVHRRLWGPCEILEDWHGPLADIPGGIEGRRAAAQEAIRKRGPYLPASALPLPARFYDLRPGQTFALDLRPPLTLAAERRERRAA